MFMFLGILGGLKWLITVMNDNLDDLDAEVFDSDVPMVPLSDHAFLSMENPAFKDFLHAIGFKKPVQHQVNSSVTVLHYLVF